MKSVIIVAGGKGIRMGYDIPKQFIPIGKYPVLMHTINAFRDFYENINIILVLPTDHQDYWQELCTQYGFEIEHTIVGGGDTRFQSVKNGLKQVNEGFVAIHDGVRPFVSTSLISNCFEMAVIHKAVIPVIDSTDSLREVLEDGKSRIIDRATIKFVQTPQVFDANVIKKAYCADFSEAFTDDASVVEASGVSVYIVKGEETNIKITRPLDLTVGNILLNNTI